MRVGVAGADRAHEGHVRGDERLALRQRADREVEVVRAEGDEDGVGRVGGVVPGRSADLVGHRQVEELRAREDVREAAPVADKAATAVAHEVALRVEGTGEAHAVGEVAVRGGEGLRLAGLAVDALAAGDRVADEEHPAFRPGRRVEEPAAGGEPEPAHVDDRHPRLGPVDDVHGVHARAEGFGEHDVARTLGEADHAGRAAVDEDGHVAVRRLRRDAHGQRLSLEPDAQRDPRIAEADSAGLRALDAAHHGDVRIGYGDECRHRVSARGAREDGGQEDRGPPQKARGAQSTTSVVDPGTPWLGMAAVHYGFAGGGASPKRKNRRAA